MGKNCENAHNDQELKEWEKMRKAQQSKKSRVRPVRIESKAEKCENFSANGCTEGCEFAHGEEEERAWRAALGKWYKGYTLGDTNVASILVLLIVEYNYGYTI